MKWNVLTLVIALCGTVMAKSPPPNMDYNHHRRAVAAATKVKPALQKDLKPLGLEIGSPVFIRAFKEDYKLELFLFNPKLHQFQLFRTYPIAAASGKPGPKLQEGDNQVPEGFYSVSKSEMKPDSRYHLAFNIGYPNAYDRTLGRTGSAIMVHGNQVSAGCMAMTDEKIEEIYTLCAAALAGGQASFQVHVFPFRMTAARMASASGTEWHEFWQNLKEGYDAFEKSHLPPVVSSRDGRYRFREPSR